MAKILFVVNMDANEAFGISAAKAAMAPLKQSGHEVFLEMVPPKDTLLGKILNVPKKRKYSLKDLKALRRKYRSFYGVQVREKKPDFIYSFHCTPEDNPYWQHQAPSRCDFSMEFYKIAEFEKPIAVTEIKAHYAKLPERMLKKIKERTTRGLRKKYPDYLEETTSQQLMRKAGLSPKVFGEAIARAIEKEVSRKRPRSHPLLFGRIKRERKPKPNRLKIRKT